MKAVLIYPPTCDPTMPYISVPLLAAWLRGRGIEVLTVDANLEAWRWLLRPRVLAGLLERVRRRLRELDGRPSLEHAEQLEYAVLGEAFRRGARLPELIPGALALLTGGQGAGFYQADRYGRAAEVVERAQALIGAAYHPLEVGFAGYRTPFSLLTAAEIERDARAERDPFRPYVEEDLLPRLRAARPGLVGLSVAFPGQLQPAFALAAALKQALPEAHLTAGGPALTQFLLAVPPERAKEALGALDTAVLFEGELALAELCAEVDAGRKPQGILRGTRLADLSELPPPDFTGLPLADYLSPEPVLPYDAARGCYWGRCAFCHYGLAETGTAPYRERPAERIAEHLLALAERHRCRIFYLSEDTVAPSLLLEVSGLLAKAGGAAGAGGSPVRWATDLRAERGLTDRQAGRLRQGGALAVSLGVESGSARVLAALDKGLTPRPMKAAVRALAAGGIAVEVMCFYDFPTETHGEAMETLVWLQDCAESIALFMFGPFKLTSGSRVAREPRTYGVRDLRYLEGDELHTELFYETTAETTADPKTPAQRRRFDAALGKLSERWRFARYPWAGSLSTAHTLLWYDRRGPDAFRREPGRVERQERGRAGRGRELPAANLKEAGLGRYAFARLARAAWENEERIWDTLTRRERTVTRAAYERLAGSLTPASPAARPGVDGNVRRGRPGAGSSRGPATPG